LRAHNAAKCDCGALGELDRFAAGRGKEGKGKEGEGKGSEKRGRGGEEGMTLMRSWNRAVDWLRPALQATNHAVIIIIIIIITLTCTFQPLAFETHGATHSSASDFLNAVGGRLAAASGDP